MTPFDYIRAGLSTSGVLASGAELADEAGIGSVGLAALAERLGVKAPALYKHIDGIGGLQHGIATLAMTELCDALRDALQGKSGADAIDALRCTIHSFALLQAANAFQWGNDPDESVAWMIRFVDAGLTAVGDNAPDR